MKGVRVASLVIACLALLIVSACDFKFLTSPVAPEPQTAPPQEQAKQDALKAYQEYLKSYLEQQKAAQEAPLTEQKQPGVDTRELAEQKKQFETEYEKKVAKLNQLREAVEAKEVQFILARGQWENDLTGFAEIDRKYRERVAEFLEKNDLSGVYIFLEPGQDLKWLSEEMSRAKAEWDASREQALAVEQERRGLMGQIAELCLDTANAADAIGKAIEERARRFQGDVVAARAEAGTYYDLARYYRQKGSSYLLNSGQIVQSIG